MHRVEDILAEENPTCRKAKDNTGKMSWGRRRKRQETKEVKGEVDLGPKTRKRIAGNSLRDNGDEGVDEQDKSVVGRGREARSSPESK